MNSTVPKFDYVGFMPEKKGNSTMSNIDSIINAIQTLSDAEKATFLTKLQDVSAGASKEAVEKRRVAAIRAAANDPDRSVAFKSSLRGLRRLGLSLEELSASADGIGDLNRAMDKSGWQTFERIQLKTSLASIGAID